MQVGKIITPQQSKERIIVVGGGAAYSNFAVPVEPGQFLVEEEFVVRTPSLIDSGQDFEVDLNLQAGVRQLSHLVSKKFLYDQNVAAVRFLLAIAVDAASQWMPLVKVSCKLQESQTKWGFYTRRCRVTTQIMILTPAAGLKSAETSLDSSDAEDSSSFELLSPVEEL